MEYIKDMSAEKQNEIRTEVTEAYRFFGYEGTQLDRLVAKSMDSTLADVCNLLGAYRWVLNDEKTAVQVICGRSVDSAIQSHFID